MLRAVSVCLPWLVQLIALATYVVATHNYVKPLGWVIVTACWRSNQMQNGTKPCLC